MTTQTRREHGTRRSAGFALTAAGLVALLAGCESTAGPTRVADADSERPAVRLAGAVQVASASGNFLAGSHAQRSRDFGAAAQFFADALAADKENRRLRLNAYLSMVASGRIAEGAPLAQEIVAQDPGSPIASLGLIAEAAKSGDFAAAARRLESLPKRGMNTFTVPLLHAWALAAQDRIDQAIQTLEPLSEIAGFSALRELHVALINEYGKREAAAEAAYKAAVQSRLSLRIARGYGAFLERRGRSDEAKALYARFLAEQPDSDALDIVADRAADGAGGAEPLVSDAREGMAEVFFNLAGTLAQSRTTEQALIYGRLAVYLRPDFPIAQLLVGGVLESLDRTAEAVAVYETIDRAGPLGWSARMRRAAGLDSLGRSDEAIAALQAMAAEQPKDDEVLVRLGDVQRAKKRYAEAAEAYSEAIRRVGKLEQRHWGVLYARGITYERLKRWPDAEKDFLQALELSPEQPYVLNYLGYSWVDQGMNLKRAQEMIERAVQLRPDDGYIVDSLGWVLYRLGDFQGATEQLERAVVLRPDDATINDHLGDAYWRVGRVLEARFQWRRALRLDPDKDLIPEIERKLRDGLAAEPQQTQGRRS